METRFFKAINRTLGKVVADKVRIAQDYRSRSMGLLNRASLEAGEGLLIKPCNSIHMFFMRFPIDVVFLDKNSRVVKVKTGLKPWRLCSCHWKGYMTLELKNSTVRDDSVRIGDTIDFE